MAILSGKRMAIYSSPGRLEPPPEYQSSRTHDKTRFEDEPAPVDDDMISMFKNLEKNILI